MNEILHRYHRYALSRVIWALSIFIGFLFAIGLGLASDNLLNKVIGFVTSVAVVGGMFFFFERLIRIKLWRIAYPEYDFQGTWSGHTEYCTSEGMSKKEQAEFQPFKISHDIRFKQDCLSVMVDYDETKAYQGWNSTIATLFKEKGKVGLRYAYEVTYRQGESRDERLPLTSRGLEEISVVASEEGKMPLRVTGTFAHTTDGPNPKYSGTVEFNRQIEEDDKEARWYESILAKIECVIVKFWLKPQLSNKIGKSFGRKNTKSTSNKCYFCVS